MAQVPTTWNNGRPMNLPGLSRDNVPSTPVDAGLIARVTQSVRGWLGMSTGQAPGTELPFFPPGRSLPPVAPSAIGRRMDYPTNYNATIRARAYEPIDFETLRALAEPALGGCELIRIAIETRKDQMAKLKFSILPRQPADAQVRPKSNAKCQAIEKFLKRPDGEHSWADWIRMLLEEHLVIDAATIYKHPNNDGSVAKLSIIDGSTIKPQIAYDGRRPLAGEIAYMQNLKGLPAVGYTVDEMIYAPRNPRVHKVYGFSCTEQVLVTVNIALRRQASQLVFFTDGNVPDAVAAVPPDWSITRIQEFQDYWDTVVNDAVRKRKMKFIPGGVTFQPTRNDQALVDQFDEWLARIIQYCFSLPPTPLVRAVNRACYSEDTQTLTRQGWKNLPDLSEQDEIATYNPVTGRLEYHLPVGLHVYEHEGEMVHFRTAVTDILVTPDHKMWFRLPNGGYRKGEATELLTQDHFYFVASASSPHDSEIDVIEFSRQSVLPGLDEVIKPILLDDWLEFLGYIISEGGISHTKHHYYVTLAQVDPHMVDLIQSCLDRCGISHSRYLDPKGCTRWGLYGKELHQYLMQECGGYAESKRIPRMFLQLGVRQQRILFEALMLGDGSWDTRENRKSGYYSTTSRQLADDVQELAFRLGYSAAVGIHYSAYGNRKTCYRVAITERAEFSMRGVARTRTPRSVEVVPYKGLVYCFEVPNHLFVTRRNGKIAIQGNTAESAYEQSLDEGLQPLMMYVKNIIDDIIARWFGEEDLEMVFDEIKKVDPGEQEQRDLPAMQQGVISRDDMRAARGLEPLGIEAVVQGIGPLGFMSVESMKKAIANGWDLTGMPQPGLGAVPGAGGEMAGMDASLLGSGQPGDPLEGLPPEILDALGVNPAGGTDASSNVVPMPPPKAGMVGTADGKIIPIHTHPAVIQALKTGEAHAKRLAARMGASAK